MYSRVPVIAGLRKDEQIMTNDKVWLISTIVCFIAALLTLTGSAIGMPDTLVRIFGVINVVSLVVTVYRTIRNKR